MQRTEVWFLVWEDLTCLRAAKLVGSNYWAYALEPGNLNYWACVMQLLKAQHLESVLHNKISHHSRKSTQNNKE